MAEKSHNEWQDPKDTDRLSASHGSAGETGSGPRWLPEFQDLYGIYPQSPEQGIAEMDQIDAHLRAAGPEGDWIFSTDAKIDGKYTSAGLVKEQNGPWPVYVVLNTANGDQKIVGPPFSVPTCVTSAQEAIHKLHDTMDNKERFNTYNFRKNNGVWAPKTTLSDEALKREIEGDRVGVPITSLGLDYLGFNGRFKFALVGQKPINELLDFLGKESLRRYHGIEEGDDFLSRVAQRGKGDRDKNPFLNAQAVFFAMTFLQMANRLARVDFPMNSTHPWIQEAYEVFKARHEMKAMEARFK